MTTLTRGRSTSPKQARASSVPPAPAAPTVVKPGMFAPAWEKKLYDAVVRHQDPAAIRQVATEHPEARPVAALTETLLDALPNNDIERARTLLGWLWSTGFDPANDAFITRYLPRAAFDLEVAPGITVTMPLTRDTIGLTLAEVHQAAGDLAVAVDVVEDVTPDTVAAVSLAELYAAQARWADVIDLTNGVTNDDEASMFLLIQRAAAVRESGSPGAAREALKEALRLRSRPPGLCHRALVERAYTYLAEGKPGMARKDLEKVLAEDATYPGLSEAMAELPTS